MLTARDVLSGDARWSVDHADCRDWLAALPDACVDAVVTDPPYPEIDREYGRLTEADWRAMMDVVVEQCRRVLKPRGSAVFILQPNSERVGRMRTWLWRFMADWGERWGIVQDAWWWNFAALPVCGATAERGLLRPSLKPCVWLGPEDCYRAQAEVLKLIGEGWTKGALKDSHASPRYGPSGMHFRRDEIARRAIERGGSCPFNVLPFPADSSLSGNSAGSEGHGAGTPFALAAWWVRYLCPPGGIVAEPFAGSGTMLLAALRQGRRAIGCESFDRYVPIARRRCAEAARQGVLDLTPRPVAPAPDAQLPLTGTGGHDA